MRLRNGKVLLGFDVYIGAGALISMMRARSIVIVGGVLQRNPFFVPLEWLLTAMAEQRDWLARRGRLPVSRDCAN